MTRVFDRPGLAGPVTRALVLGVGAYPNAQNPADEVETLRAVPENVSSATGAALFTDWLIRNADRLELPLASIDLMLCAVDPGPPRNEIAAYVWQGRVPAPAGAVDPRGSVQVTPPTSANLAVEGKAWLADLKARPGSHAVFYGCGHGTTLPGKAMLLLQDLNADTGDAWAAHFDVTHHALAFDQIPELGRATLFLDACAENLDVLRRMPPGNGVRLANHFAERPGERKVYALAAAASPSLTFEGDIEGSPGVKAGRFTQCLVKALDGAAVQLLNGVNSWGVLPEGLPRILAKLYRLRDDWRNDTALQPKVIEDPVDATPIVTHTPPVLVPLCVEISPELDTPAWALSVFNNEVPAAGVCLHHRPSGAFARWIVQIPVGTQRYALVAQRANPPTADHIFPVLPTQALFDLRVP